MTTAGVSEAILPPERINSLAQARRCSKLSTASGKRTYARHVAEVTELTKMQKGDEQRRQSLISQASGVLQLQSPRTESRGEDSKSEDSSDFNIWGEKEADESKTSKQESSSSKS